MPCNLTARIGVTRRPMTISMIWPRRNSAGNACAAIPNIKMTMQNLQGDHLRGLT